MSGGGQRKESDHRQWVRELLDTDDRPLEEALMSIVETWMLGRLRCCRRRSWVGASHVRPVRVRLCDKSQEKSGQQPPTPRSGTNGEPQGFVQPIHTICGAELESAVVLHVNTVVGSGVMGKYRK